MDVKLNKAAEQGDVNALYALIGSNPDLLDSIAVKPFVTNPLHVAASTGQMLFAMEVMMLKPSFARQLNEQGFSPMHLALQNGQTQVVLQLLLAMSDLVCVKGRGGRTPLHVVAETGELYLLRIFLSACPQSIEEVTVQQETALHCALKSEKLEVFLFLVKWIKEASRVETHYRERMILNWKDMEGNSLAYCSIQKPFCGNIYFTFLCIKICQQDQALEVLAKNSEVLDINVRNREDLTASDMIDRQPGNEEILNLLGAREYFLPPIDDCGHYLRRDERLMKSAEEGDLSALYGILRDDPFVLDRIDEVPFLDTPLHIAASAGHTKFALEMLRLKPSFARKLNRDGYNPVLIAIRSKNFRTASRLLEADSSLVHVKGREDFTPLHCAAEIGEIDLLAQFLEACPRSIKDLSARKQTALHVAANSLQLESLRVLIGWVEHTGLYTVLDWKDEEGNTVLHIASERNLINAVRMLTGAASSWIGGLIVCSPLFMLFFLFGRIWSLGAEPFWPLGVKVDLNARNSKNETAVDILGRERQLECWRIRALRCIALAVQMPSSCCKAATLSDYLRMELSPCEKWALNGYRENLLMTDTNRNAVLVVAVLIATTTYQAVLQPPGGVFQADPTSPLLMADAPTPQYDDELLKQRKIFGILLGNNPFFGVSVMNWIYWIVFSFCNFIAFAMSLLKMMDLIPHGPHTVLWLVLALFTCYSLSVMVITPFKLTMSLVIYVGFCHFCLLFWCFLRTMMIARRKRIVKLLVTKESLGVEHKCKA